MKKFFTLIALVACLAFIGCNTENCNCCKDGSCNVNGCESDCSCDGNCNCQGCDCN